MNDMDGILGCGEGGDNILLVFPITKLPVDIDLYKHS